MNAVTSTWRQLVRRRLWPVALLLLAALAAVPVLFAREPEAPAPLAPLPVSVEADDTIAEPVVAKVTSEDRARRRRVLGVRKDPFSPAPAPVKKAKKAEAEAGEKAKEPAKTAPEAAKPSSPATPAPVGGGQPAPEKRYFSAGTIVVRFGSADGSLERFAVQKFEPLPDDELPLLIYMGLTKNGKKAKFLVDAAVEVDGDGTCRPHPSTCETVELAVGETEFLDVIDQEPEAEEAEDGEETEDEDEGPEILAQYQLDLVDIKRAGDDDVK